MTCCLLESSSLDALILDVGKKGLSLQTISYLPNKPSATIRLGAILFPRTKVMTTYMNAGCYMKYGKVDNWKTYLQYSPNMFPRLESSAVVRETLLISVHLHPLDRLGVYGHNAIPNILPSIQETCKEVSVRDSPQRKPTLRSYVTRYQTR